MLEGQGGADTFVFTTGDGIDRIHGFELAVDLIRFEEAVAGFGDLSIYDYGGDAAVAYGFGDVILLTGIDFGLLTAGQFDFA